MQLDDVGVRAEPLHCLDFPQIVGLFHTSNQKMLVLVEQITEYFNYIEHRISYEDTRTCITVNILLACLKKKNTEKFKMASIFQDGRQGKFILALNLTIFIE